MAFREDFIKVVNGEPQSLYDAFVELSERRLPSDAYERYQYLRSPQGKFVARDEADVDVYVTKVARRHLPKFKWLYKSLYQSYQEVFSKDIDLVVWGCGCGLDLLAFYDCAQEQKNPQLWTKVRHITLVDISAAALERARQIAKILFPLAVQEGIQEIECDLTDATKVKNIKLRQLNPYLPRVHLISNLLDLFSAEQTRAIAKLVKECSSRKICFENRTYHYYNELLIAFSPEYRGGRVAQNMQAFRNEWGENKWSEEIKTIGDEPLKCESCSFTYRSLRERPLFQLYMSGKSSALNSLIANFPVIEPWLCFPHFVSELSKLKVDGVEFFESDYRWVTVDRWGKEGDLKPWRPWRIIFIASPSVQPRLAPLTIELSSYEDAAEKALKHLQKIRGEKTGNGGKLSAGGKADDFAVAWWDEKKNKKLTLPNKDGWWKCKGETDYSLYFRIDPKGAKPLPDLSKMDVKQKEVVYSRAQYRKIRGAAGCGKSTVMMLHAVHAYMRTHLPILLVSKTVTLFNRNSRRLAATVIREISGLDYVDLKNFQFATIDRVLCEHTQSEKCCLMRQCVKNRNNRMFICDGKGCGGVPRLGCKSFKAREELERKASAEDWRKAKEYEEKLRRACCNECQAGNIERFARMGTKSASKFEPYGAILIDEVQSTDPRLVQAIVNLSYGGNLGRECYIFCDERQTLESDAVEKDVEVGKLRVKIPRGGTYGHWVTLNKPYRFVGDLSGRLAEVAGKLRSLTNQKYGEVELEKLPRQESLPIYGQGVFAIRKSTGSLSDEVQKEIDDLKKCGAKSITIICDRNEDVYALLGCGEFSKCVSTHSSSKDHREEQELRSAFYEQEEGIQLTSLMSAQGCDFSNVVFVMTTEKTGQIYEKVLTGVTRASSRLRILDCSPSGWLSERLQSYND